MRSIENGKKPPQSKGLQLQLLQEQPHVITCLLKNENASYPIEKIKEDCCRRAISYVQHLHSQKELFIEFIKTITATQTEKPKFQLITLYIKTGNLLFSEWLIRKLLRTTQKAELLKITKGIGQYGKLESSHPLLLPESDCVHQKNSWRRNSLVSRHTLHKRRFHQ